MYDQEIFYLKSWLHDRMAWIDANLPNSGARMDYSYPLDARASIVVSVQPNPLHGDGTILLQSDRQ